MPQWDVVNKWVCFKASCPAAGSAYRFALTDVRDGPDTNRWKPWDYIEIDNRGNKGNTIYWSPNGRTASSSLATAAHEQNMPIFRLPADSIDRLFIKATSVSVVSATNGTSIIINCGRY